MTVTLHDASRRHFFRASAIFPAPISQLCTGGAHQARRRHWIIHRGTLPEFAIVGSLGGAPAIAAGISGGGETLDGIRTVIDPIELHVGTLDSPPLGVDFVKNWVNASLLGSADALQDEVGLFDYLSQGGMTTLNPVARYTRCVSNGHRPVQPGPTCR